jgi:hypothetical protein
MSIGQGMHCTQASHPLGIGPGSPHLAPIHDPSQHDSFEDK